MSDLNCKIHIPDVEGLPQNEITVGRHFYIRCSGEWNKTFDFSKAQLKLNENEALFFKLVQAEARDTQNFELDFLVYKTGLYKNLNLTLFTPTEEITKIEEPQKIEEESLKTDSTTQTKTDPKATDVKATVQEITFLLPDFEVKSILKESMALQEKLKAQEQVEIEKSATEKNEVEQKLSGQNQKDPKAQGHTQQSPPQPFGYSVVGLPTPVEYIIFTGAIVFVIVSLFIYKILERQKLKTLKKQLVEHEKATPSEQEFYKEVRKIDTQDEHSKTQIIKLEKQFRVYCLRSFQAPILEMTPHEIKKYLNRNWPEQKELNQRIFLVLTDSNLLLTKPEFKPNDYHNLKEKMYRLVDDCEKKLSENDQSQEQELESEL